MKRPEVHYLVVSRHCLHLYQDLVHLLRGREDIRIIIDRRRGERRKVNLPVREEKRREERRKGAHLILV